MNILIINPPIRLNDKPRHIPHGLAILANIIRKQFKINIHFVDWNAQRFSEKKFNNIVKEYPCQLALIGGLISTYKYLVKISHSIKKHHPLCKVIAGGSAAMSLPEVLLKNSRVDIICTGEG
ncbi:radical SAM protein, partial [Candidatus Magnetomorum sp. HK-1]